ncbi:MAG TPA: fructosamine kinase family protein [Acidimicrobiia bacterium]|nr:fructosamine kinase family protein [Acidimicrobiia bacterium]
MDDELAATLGTALGSPVRRLVPVRGGDVATAYAVDLADGRGVFAKTHPGAPAGFFTTEALGLGWLREAGAVRVPELLTVSDAAPNHLVLAWIDEGSPRPSTEPDLGTGLAALHRAGAPRFGREDRRTTGSRGLPNEPTETWSEFYASNRLAPLARLAADAGVLPAGTIDGLDRLAGTLDRFETGEPPARLHGDLWAGNRLVDAGGASWLIDPAAHGGHREFDLAMMRLFGGFGAACFDAYDEVFPLVSGWQERVDLHQIAPLVVHAIKFGGHYRDAAARAVGRYVPLGS